MSEQQSTAMTEREVARKLRISPATLRTWRVRRKGPRYVRFGRAVRYLSADIDQFIAPPWWTTRLQLTQATCLGRRASTSNELVEARRSILDGLHRRRRPVSEAPSD